MKCFNLAMYVGANAWANEQLVPFFNALDNLKSQIFALNTNLFD